MQRLYTCGVINKNVADTEEKKKSLKLYINMQFLYSDFAILESLLMFIK